MGRFAYLFGKTGDTSSPFSFTSFVTAAAGATITPTSLVADVFSAEEAVITMIATSAGASTGTITFNWLGRAHLGAPWPTVADFSTTLVLRERERTNARTSSSTPSRTMRSSFSASSTGTGATH